MISSFFSSVRSFYSLAIHHDCQTPTQPLKCLQLTLFSYRKKEKKRICSQCHGVPRSTFHLFPHFIWDERHSTKLPEVLNLSIQQSMEFFFFSFEDSVLTIKHHDSTFDYNGTMERLAPKMEFGTDESVFMDESNGKKTKR